MNFFDFFFPWALWAIKSKTKDFGEHNNNIY
jgi:hypothetical protein